MSSVGRRFAAAALAGAVIVAGCSDIKGEAGTVQTSSKVACADELALGTKPAKHLASCLAPSVVLISVDETPMGSGVLVEHDGETYAVTNLHVVDPSPVVDVTLTGAGGTTIEDAEVVGVDKAADIAVVGPISTERPGVDLAEPTVTKGDDVYLVGYPGETEKDPEATISKGIVSRLRNDEVFDLGYIQTDASIGGGQSGGALADEAGHVVGISGLSIAEDFALALSGADVESAVDRILSEDGDDYWTFPSKDGEGGATTGTFALRGMEMTETLFLETTDATTVDLRVEPPTDIGVSAFDWETGENLFTDRQAMMAVMQASGMNPDPATVEQMVKEQGVKLGDAVSPGHYRIDVPANTRVAFDIGQVGDGQRERTWTSSVPLFTQPEDEVDVPLPVGEKHRGFVDLMESEATYKVDLEEGQKVRVRVASSAGDPGVVILAPGQPYADGWHKDDSDVGLYGTDVDEEFTAGPAGTYDVIVENYGEATLAYELQLTKD